MNDFQDFEEWPTNQPNKYHIEIPDNKGFWKAWLAVAIAGGLTLWGIWFATGFIIH